MNLLDSETLSRCKSANVCCVAYGGKMETAEHSLREAFRRCFENSIAHFAAQAQRVEFLLLEKNTPGAPVSVIIPTSGYCYLSIHPDALANDNQKTSLCIKQAAARGFFRAIRKGFFPQGEDTLGGLLVSEGLSRVFAREIGYPYEHPSVALPPEHLTDYAACVKGNLACTGHHVPSFFPKDIDMSVYAQKSDGVHMPQWGGYSLGTALALGWMEHTRTTASQNIGIKAEDITKAWVNGSFNLRAARESAGDWTPVRSRPRPSREQRPVAREFTA